LIKVSEAKGEKKDGVTGFKISDIYRTYRTISKVMAMNDLKSLVSAGLAEKVGMDAGLGINTKLINGKYWVIGFF